MFGAICVCRRAEHSIWGRTGACGKDVCSCAIWLEADEVAAEVALVVVVHASSVLAHPDHDIDDPEWRHVCRYSCRCLGFVDLGEYVWRSIIAGDVLEEAHWLLPKSSAVV